jgi:hypothetical protein
MDTALFSPLTVVGVLWTLATVFLLLSGKGIALTRQPRLLFLTTPLMLLSVIYVASQAAVIGSLAGGLAPLDVHLGYRTADLTAFAEALGEDGRRAYAAFQLGADTLAPPGIACFILNVSRSTVRSERTQSLLVVIIGTYFLSVLAANTLMPVVMLNYPDRSGWLGGLYSLVPLLDLIKYSTHGLVWLIIVGGWAVWPFRRARAKEDLRHPGSVRNP